MLTFSSTTMNSILLARLAVAATWLYQGIWVRIISHNYHIYFPWKISHLSPSVLGIFTGVIEILLGVAVLIGIWTKPLAITQLILMLVAIVIAIAYGYTSHPIGFIISELPFVACIGMLAAQGAGKWSVS
jgi:uncharacterized membrane protein YphA (DoxX/SURF4 family)